MNEEIIVSIVVPTYNRAQLIERTLKSILSQNSPEFEVLIIDDGSTDNTFEVVEPFISNNVHYIKVENGERAKARNIGTNKAIGKYVNWFDSDDFMFSNHVEQIVLAINKNDSPEVISLEHEIRTFDFKFISKNNFTKSSKRDLLISGNHLACNSAVVRRDIALKFPFIEDLKLTASEDYELWLRLKSHFQFIHLPVCTSYLIQHDLRSVNTMSDSLKLEARFLSFLRHTCENSDIVKFLGPNLSYFRMKNYLILAVDLAYNKHKKKAFHYLRMAVKENKTAIFNKVFWATIKHLLF